MHRRDPKYTSVCDGCYMRTWYTTDPHRDYRPEPGDRYRAGPCRECGHDLSYHFSTAPTWPKDGKHTCGGTLHMIDRSGLAPQFTPYYESEQRIRVAFVGRDGEVYEELTGTVGKTTGWRPTYLLMLRSNSMGSPYALHERDRVVAVKRGRTYIPVQS